MYWVRDEQWSFFGSDGMVMFGNQLFFGGFATLWPSPLTAFILTDYWAWWFFNGFWVTQPSPLNDFQPPDHCFYWISMVLGSFKHWFQWFSMIMDQWSNDLMVVMDRSPLYWVFWLYWQSKPWKEARSNIKIICIGQVKWVTDYSITYLKV